MFGSAYTHIYIYIYIYIYVCVCVCVEKTCLITNIYNDKKRNTANESNNYITYKMFFLYVYRNHLVYNSIMCIRHRNVWYESFINTILVQYAPLSVLVMPSQIWRVTNWAEDKVPYHEKYYSSFRTVAIV